MNEQTYREAVELVKLLSTTLEEADDTLRDQNQLLDEYHLALTRQSKRIQELQQLVKKLAST